MRLQSPFLNGLAGMQWTGSSSNGGEAGFFTSAPVSAAGLAVAALATSAMGLHYVFGAFAFGVLGASRPSLAGLAAGSVRIATWIGALLLPPYLVLPGATTNFRNLDLGAGREVLIVLAVAAGSKLIAGTFSAHRTGLSRHDSLAVGVLLNTRGLVELVALGIGLSAGLLDTNLYAVLVIMAVVTTVATSPSLRLLAFLRDQVRDRSPPPRLLCCRERRTEERAVSICARRRSRRASSGGCRAPTQPAHRPDILGADGDPYGRGLATAPAVGDRARARHPPALPLRALLDQGRPTTRRPSR